MLPLPRTFFRFALFLSFETHVANAAVPRKQLLPAMQIFRQLEDLRFRQEVVLIGEVPHRPNQPGGGHLGLCFGAKFDLPFHSGVVPDQIFWVRSIKILFDECKGTRARRMLRTANSIEEVARFEICRFPPQQGSSALGSFCAAVSRFGLMGGLSRDGATHDYRSNQNGKYL